MKPVFLGIGAQKCASTWSYQVLSDHPQLFVSTPKELDFFSLFYDRGFQWYENFFREAKSDVMSGEISPSYLYDLDAPARARAYNPDFKIILNLRDPVERAYSNHLHDIRLQHFTGSDLSFEAGLANNPMYLEQSRYARHLKRWLEFFPKEQIFVVLQEDVHQDAEAQALKLYEFLGVDSSHKSTHSSQKANESYLPKSREKELFLKKIGAFLAQLGLGRLADLLRRSSWYQAYKQKNRLDIRKVVPPMQEGTRRELEQEFLADMNELLELLERDELPWKSWRSSQRIKKSYDVND